MRRLMVVAACAAISGAAQAAPYIVSDSVDPTVTHCGFKLDAAARVDVPVVVQSPTSKICRWDIASVAVGSHTVNATAIVIDAVWGRQESAPSANFTFARPATAPAPTGLAITP